MTGFNSLIYLLHIVEEDKEQLKKKTEPEKELKKTKPKEDKET